MKVPSLVTALLSASAVEEDEDYIFQNQEQQLLLPPPPHYNLVVLKKEREIFYPFTASPSSSSFYSEEDFDLNYSKSSINSRERESLQNLEITEQNIGKPSFQMMETVFYEDYTSSPMHSNYATPLSNMSNQYTNINQLKRKMTLDLDFSTNSGGVVDLTSPTSGKTSVIKKARVLNSSSLQTPSLVTPVHGINQVNKVEILSSPDFHMLKLDSPQLEKLIMQNSNLLATPTPNQSSQIFFPSNVTEQQELYAKGFADALQKIQFEEKLKQETHTNNNNNSNIINSNNNNNNSNQPTLQLHQHHHLTHVNPQVVIPATTAMTNSASNIPIIVPTTISSNNNIHHSSSHNNQQFSEDSSGTEDNSNSMTDDSSYSAAGSYYAVQHHNYAAPASGQTGHIINAQNISGIGHQIKEEPQTVPQISHSQTSSPPMSPGMSPIDMEDQERIKLERKRQRNRVAASKCRKRKLERISKLEDKVKLLKGENNDLNSVLDKLRDTVSTLKQQVIDHVNAGCQISLMSPSNLHSFC